MLNTLIFLRSNTTQHSKSPDIYTTQSVSVYAKLNLKYSKTCQVNIQLLMNNNNIYNNNSLPMSKNNFAVIYTSKSCFDVIRQ